MDTNGTSALAVYDQPRLTLIPPESTSSAAMALAKMAAASGLCKTRQPADAFFIIMYGYELGIPAMTALRTIHIINNTPVCSGEAMLALIRRSGKVEIKITGDAEKATVYMKRRDTGEDYTAHWSLERGRKAGLLDKAGSNWSKYSQQMMQWRGVSECAKFLCSDIVGGLYTIEEIAPDTALNEDGEVVGQITITAPRWHDDEAKVSELVSRACNAGYIADCTLAALLALLKKDSLNDYATLAEAANAVKEAGEARKAAQASLRHYTIITDKAHIAMDETVTFETEHGKLEIKRSELLYKLETSGNATDRLNGRQQAEQMQLDHWGHTSPLGHNREFKNARLIIEYDVYINGTTRLSITSVRPETDWLNKVPPAPKPTPAPAKIDLNAIPE